MRAIVEKQFDQSRDDIHRRAWQLLKVLQTPSGAKHRIQTCIQGNHLNERSSGISSLLISANQYYDNYLESRSIVDLYYMCFKLIQCFIILKSATSYSLLSLQDSSKLGHGIKMELIGGHFPKAVYFYYTEGGMFQEYLKMRGWTGMQVKRDKKKNIVQTIADEKRTELEQRNVYKADNLLRRIPELSLYQFDLGLGHPLWYQTGQGAGIQDPGAEILLDDGCWKSITQMKRAIAHINQPMAAYNAIEVGRLKFSPEFNSVYLHDTHLKLPLQNYWIEKLGEVGDQISIYFSLLYILSILARYYPAEWERMIKSGKNLNPFIETFSSHSLNAFPWWLTTEIYGKTIY